MNKKVIKFIFIIIVFIFMGASSDIDLFQDLLYTYKDMNISYPGIEIIDYTDKIDFKEVNISEEQIKLYDNYDSETYLVKKWHKDNIYFSSKFFKFLNIIDLQRGFSGYIYFPYKNGKFRFSSIDKKEFDKDIIHDVRYITLCLFKKNVSNHDERWNDLFVFLNEMYYNDNFVKVVDEIVDQEQYHFINKVGNTFYIWVNKSIGLDPRFQDAPAASINYVLKLNIITKSLEMINFGLSDIVGPPHNGGTREPFDISYNHRYIYFRGLSKDYGNVTDDYFKKFFKKVPKEFVHGYFCFDTFENKLYILNNSKTPGYFALDKDDLYLFDYKGGKITVYKAKTPFDTNGYKEGPKLIK